MSNTAQQKKILNTIKKTVADSVQGVLNDPDYGKEIANTYHKKLTTLQARKTKKTASLKAVKKRFA